MENIGNTILALVVGCIFLFVVPMVTLTDRMDNVAQENTDLIVSEFVTDLTNTGVLTRTKYQEFENELASTGNVYDVEIEINVLDENPEKKTAQANYTKIGENVYVTYYTAQVLPRIGIKVGEEAASSSDTFILKEGDFVSVKVTNQNPTASQTSKSTFLGFSNADEYVISSQDSGMVTVNGVDN